MTGPRKDKTRSDGDCPSGSIKSARGWKGGGRADLPSSRAALRVGSLPGRVARACRRRLENNGERRLKPKLVRPARTGTVQAGRANRRGGGRGADAPIELSSAPRLSRRDQLASDAYWSRAPGIWFTTRSKNLSAGISVA